MGLSNQPRGVVGSFHSANASSPPLQERKEREKKEISQKKENLSLSQWPEQFLESGCYRERLWGPQDESPYNHFS